MQIWLEIIGSHPKRLGKYLICPVHSSTQENYHLYKILGEPMVGDIVFHYLLGKVSKKPNAFISYSTVKRRFYFVDSQDPFCQYPPPYRRVDLEKNTLIKRPITMKMLSSYREELESISRKSGLSRTPFDKNFNIKQLYLSRIPLDFIKIFSKISGTNFTFKR